jgi:hypothetical protein
MFKYLGRLKFPILPIEIKNRRERFNSPYANQIICSNVKIPIKLTRISAPQRDTNNDGKMTFAEWRESDSGTGLDSEWAKYDTAGAGYLTEEAAVNRRVQVGYSY